VPSVVGSDPVKDQERARKAYLILLGGLHEARPSVKDIDRMIENLQKVSGVFMAQRRDLLSRGFCRWQDRWCRGCRGL
jgi:hypothetical protein